MGRIRRSLAGRLLGLGRNSSRRGSAHWGLRVACGVIVLAGALALALPWGCSPSAGQGALTLAGRTIRVRLHQSVDQVMVKASHPPVYYVSSEGTERLLDLPRNTAMAVILTPSGWRVGGTSLGSGELVLRPAAVGSVAMNDRSHRGQYRLVGAGGNRFDVVNDVDMDDYLMGVVSRELLPNWHDETYRAQAIAARTYALYEKHVPREPRHWDVYADERSQVYGGIAAESAKSRDAVEATRGIVLAYGPEGNERIFKAYFSACCGGVTQSVTHAFNEPYMQPLSEQHVGPLCSACPRYNWGPVVISKQDLTRRFNQWGLRRQRPEQSMALVQSITVEARNQYGRPTWFTVTDARGTRYALRGEELRWAVNTDAPEGTTLSSSFIDNIISDSDRVRFVGGHGFGHGVGMCQWCAEARARAGMRHEDILAAAYPGASLLRAY